MLCLVAHRVQIFAIPWTVAHQAPLSMGFSRQEYWSVLPFLHPGDLPDPGIEPVSAVSPALKDSLRAEPSGEAQMGCYLTVKLNDLLIYARHR